MVRLIGSVGGGFGSNLLNLYELAAAIEDAQQFLRETNGSEEVYDAIVATVEEQIEVTSSRLTIITNIKEPSEEDLEQIESISKTKDYLAYKLEWLLFHGEQMKQGYWA
jgi:translation initiation factor 2 alpha subunit (eIF-2alpha)